jgi:hypothetical protein
MGWITGRSDCFRNWLGQEDFGHAHPSCQRAADRLKEGKGLSCQSKDLRVGHNYEQAAIIDGH